jgi:group II intron reverse transcriptase/maturase
MYWKSRVIDLRHNCQLIYMVQRPKCGLSEGLGTAGNPKGRKTYGSGGLVRSLGTKRVYSATTLNAFACGSLKELMNLNRLNKQLINDKLIHIIANPEVLILAYETIKSKLRNKPPNVNAQTLDGIDLNWVQRTSKLLLAGKYKFKAARRVYRPKKGNNKKRPLTISSPRDKIVQQAMYRVLNAIYESSFLECSHGSRPGKGTHTALKSVKLKFQGVKWCIEADIESNFPSISHKILLSLLRKRISCEKFLILVKRSIKAGFIEDGIFKESNKGLFQGNVTSPILNNIYLHELDVFMDGLCKDFTLGESRKTPSLYRNIQYRIEKTTDMKFKKKLCRKLWQIHSKDPMDPNFKKLFYVRYVDDFVIGVVGSRKDAADTKMRVKCFLEEDLKLILNDEKSLITQFSKTPIFFLGTLIKGNWATQKRVKLVKRKNVLRKVRIMGCPVLKAPINDLFLKATVNGFFKKKAGKFVPTKVGWLINLDHTNILRYYNSVIRGILSFYSFANNRKSLGSLIHGIKFSCARTLALKYKLRFASKTFSRFGGKLKCPDTGLELFIPKTFRVIKEFAINAPIPDESLFKRWNNKLTRSNLFKYCVICGSSYQVKIHHVRKIKNLKFNARKDKIDFFSMQMASITRKQVPFCRTHHKALRKNSLSSLERQQLKAGLDRLK